MATLDVTLVTPLAFMLASPLAKSGIKSTLSPREIVLAVDVREAIVGAATTSTSMVLVNGVPKSLVTVKE